MAYHRIQKKNENELCHFGIKGMKWGRRRYQNRDGSLTPAGRKRYVDKSIDEAKKSGRLVGVGNSNLLGIKQKNGDVLIVDANEVRNIGVDEAEKKALSHIKTMQRRTAKGKARVDKMFRDEEKTVVRETIKTYSKNDPDREEALRILREIEKGR